MKKISIFLLLAIATSLSYAAIEIAQVIVTDCGTTHQVPPWTTTEEACDLVEYWSKIDCP